MQNDFGSLFLSCLIQWHGNQFSQAKGKKLSVEGGSALCTAVLDTRKNELVFSETNSKFLHKYILST